MVVASVRWFRESEGLVRILCVVGVFKFCVDLERVRLFKWIVTIDFMK